MIFTPLKLKGAYAIDPEPFVDERGAFSRIFCSNEFADVGLDMSIAQMNHSVNTEVGTVRGLHFQYPPKAETKVVKCIKGKIFDVLVDLRKGAPTFLQWHGEELSAENRRSLVVPPGFAHGFQVLEAGSELIYFCSEFYSPGCEGGVSYQDERIGIQWPLGASVVSERDSSHPLLARDFEGIEI